MSTVICLKSVRILIAMLRPLRHVNKVFSLIVSPQLNMFIKASSKLGLLLICTDNVFKIYLQATRKELFIVQLSTSVHSVNEASPFLMAVQTSVIVNFHVQIYPCLIYFIPMI